MATVSPALVMPFPLGSGSLMGQGSQPEFQLRIATSAATVDPPTWMQVPLATSKLRSYSVKRGRDSELDIVDAATLEAVVDNNNRRFDPTHIANAILNPSFEVDLSNWSEVDANATLTPTRDTTQKQAGAASLKMVQTTAGENDFLQATFAVTAGEVWTVSAYVFVQTFTAAAIDNRGLLVFDGTNILVDVKITAATSGFVRLSGTFTAPLTQPATQVRIYAPQGTVFWDAVQAEGAAQLLEYLDGAQPGAQWAGTPHASTTRSGLKPGNQIWLRALFSGSTHDRFVGDVNSYTQRWPHAGHDAETSITAADAIQRLSRAKLPSMDPATAPTYADVVKYDEPAGYWRFSNSNLSGDPGPAWTIPGTGGYSIAVNVSPIIGQDTPDTGVLFMAGSSYLIETTNDAFDTQSSGQVTVDFWFRFAGTPGSTHQVMGGRVNAANTLRSWYVNATTGRTLQFVLTNTGGTAHTVTTTTVLRVDTWYHILVGSDGSDVYIVVNGTLEASTAWSGTIVTNSDDVSATLFPHITGAASFNFYLDELAFYPARSLGTAGATRHYVAGAQRGYPHGQTTFERAGHVLDDTGLHAPRRFVVTTNAATMRARFKHGQPPIEELREAERLELSASTFLGFSGTGLLFVARDGTITFLGSEHRDVSPWDTVQATFGEAGGSEIPYTDVAPDYSNAFLVNRWEGQAEGGLLQTALDQTSIDLYGESSQSLTGLQATDDNTVAALINDLLTKTKDPQHRIVSLSAHTGDPDTCEALLRLDIGDRIRVLWTPPAGGSRIDQTSFVQSINETASREDPRVFFKIGITPR